MNYHKYEVLLTAHLACRTRYNTLMVIQLSMTGKQLAHFNR